jgi:predicted glycoside hydrolase/deacetylase ChbG (UPF0249 family)
VVVVHADDIGMCHATLPAIDELMAFGLVTSASVMVPCPWFLEPGTRSRKLSPGAGVVPTARR